MSTLCCRLDYHIYYQPYPTIQIKLLNFFVLSPLKYTFVSTPMWCSDIQDMLIQGLLDLDEILLLSTICLKWKMMIGEEEEAKGESQTFYINK
jgi:hypothetical protein